MTPCDSRYFTYPTPHGPITIRITGQGVSAVVFGDVVMDGENKPSELANRLATEVQEYFAGKRRTFDTPINPAGTKFQMAVWNELQNIAYGQSKTSADIAKLIQAPTSFKAVGSAARKNPLALLIPEHRLVSAAGAPLGTGKEARLRKALLELERNNL